MLRYSILIASLLFACAKEKHPTSSPPTMHTPLVVGECWREEEASGLSFDFWPPVQIAEVGDKLVVIDRINDSSGLWIKKFALEKKFFAESYQQLECPSVIF